MALKEKMCTLSLGCCDVQILNTLGAPYETVNILESELLRQGMKEYSQWPTFPQVYIDGEFYGGCDIMIGEAFIICLLAYHGILIVALSVSGLSACPSQQLIWPLKNIWLEALMHMNLLPLLHCA